MDYLTNQIAKRPANEKHEKLQQQQRTNKQLLLPLLLLCSVENRCNSVVHYLVYFLTFTFRNKILSNLFTT